MLILVDFANDCNVAGFSRDEADDLGSAWRGALAYLCEQLGIEAGSTGDAGRATKTPVGNETAEEFLWHAAHDCLYRDGDAELGERWQWQEKPSVIKAVRTSLASLLPA